MSLDCGCTRLDDDHGDVRHESPQMLVLRDDQETWSAPPGAIPAAAGAQVLRTDG